MPPQQDRKTYVQLLDLFHDTFKVDDGTQTNNNTEKDNSARTSNNIQTNNNNTQANSNTQTNNDPQMNPKLSKIVRTRNDFEMRSIRKTRIAPKTNIVPNSNTRWYWEYLFSKLKPFDEFFVSVCPPQRGQNDEEIQGWYLEAVLSLRTHVLTYPAFTYTTAASHLEKCGVLRPSSDETHSHVQTYFVFCLIGVLTCLYQPTTYGLVRRLYTIEEIDTQTSHRYSCVYNGKVNRSEASRPVCRVLKMFGELLPTTDTYGNTKPDRPSPLYSNQIDAYVILSVVKLNIVWTDILGAHLDFDDRTKTLYVFKLPSFCLQNCTERKTIIDASITDEDNEDGVANDLMSEIILSIFMIFGQNVKARHALQQHKPLQKSLHSTGDPVLQSICEGTWPSKDIGRQSKAVYHLPTDFPLTGAKLEYLRQFMAEQEPKGIRQLWKDKRNSLQWYTLWAVVIIGGIGIALAFVQIALGSMQVYYAAKAVNEG